MLVNRRASLLALLVFLPALLLATVVVAAADAQGRDRREATRLVLQDIVDGQQSGSPVSISGRLIRERFAQPLARQSVKVESRVGKAGSWRPEGRIQTDANGDFSVTTTPVKTTTYRFSFAGTKKTLKASQASVTVSPAQSLIVTSQGPSIVDAGEEVWLAGETGPGLAGEPVVMQQFTGDTWSTVARSTVASDRSFRVGTTAAFGGFEQRFRVLAPATDRVTSAVSDERTVTVYAWYPLTSMTPNAERPGDEQSVNFVARSARVDGVSHGSSWVSAYHAEAFSDPFERGQAAFKPLTSCDGLDVTMGVEAPDGSKGRWQFEIFIDGAQYNYGYIGRGESKRLTLDLTAITRFRLANRRDTSVEGEVDAVWGSGRIKCAGQP